MIWKDKSFQVPFFIILILFLAVFVFSRLGGTIPVSVNSVQTQKTNLFTATGTGKATAIPDSAQISLGVTETSNSISDLQQKLNTKTNSIIDALKKLGVEEKNIKTSNYSISPTYDFTQGQRITGYTASQNLDIKTNIELANRTVDTATAAGANVVGGVNFTFDDATREKLENEARKQAVAEAKKKAQSLASVAGIRLGRVIDVQEQSMGGVIPVAQSLRLDAGEANKTDSTTNLTPGENSIEITVTLSYETF